MKFKERIEQSPVLAVLTSVALGFGSGITAYSAILQIAQLEIQPKEARLLDGKVAFRVESIPADANVKITGSSDSYYPGIRLKPGRYELDISAPGYQLTKSTVQLSYCDHV